MDTVLLLLWAGDVANALIPLGLLVGFAYPFALAISYAFPYEDSSKAKEVSAFIRSKWWVALLLAALALFCPSKRTLEIMAAGKAAQIGSQVIAESALGKKSADALNAILDRVIREAGK